MKGKGYRSNAAKAVWIVIVHLAAVAAVICAAFFVMIYQTGIRLDDKVCELADEISKIEAVNYKVFCENADQS